MRQSVIQIGLYALDNKRRMALILKGGRVMNIAFIVLSAALGLIAAGSGLLHWHNSIEIERYLSSRDR